MGLWLWSAFLDSCPCVSPGEVIVQAGGISSLRLNGIFLQLIKILGGLSSEMDSLYRILIRPQKKSLTNFASSFVTSSHGLISSLGILRGVICFNVTCQKVLSDGPPQKRVIYLDIFALLVVVFGFIT